MKDFSRAVFVKNLLRIGQNEMQIFQTSCACVSVPSALPVNSSMYRITSSPSHSSIACLCHRQFKWSSIHTATCRPSCGSSNARTDVSHSCLSDAIPLLVSVMEIGRRSSQPVLRIPLSSPNSARRLSTPARHKDCSAVFCFELEMALLAFQDAEFIHCPCCT